VQLVSDPSASLYSRLLYNEWSGEQQTFTAQGTADILQLLSAEDLEDVVAVYLQVAHRCFIFPSTCKISTMAVECVFITPEGKRIGLQVKSGSAPINQDDYATFDGTVYLFAASGQYPGGPHPNCFCLAPEAIRTFLQENRALMPGKIQRWIKYANSVALEA
jgi:hypothetical protein